MALRKKTKTSLVKGGVTAGRKVVKEVKLPNMVYFRVMLSILLM